MDFKLISPFEPQGDQPEAIKQLTESVRAGNRHQVLLGVTGSGKTFTVAKVVEKINRPTLVLSHNKTLAAQLYQEFKNFFPENRVEYFVSYYDYYQPEAYIPQTDLYIEKEMTKNDEIDKLRLAATKSLFERRDVIIVASVSCIYGIGDPDLYFGMLLFFERGIEKPITHYLRRLTEMQYERTPYDLSRGTFRVRGDVLELWPAYEDDAVRIEFFGDEIDKISRIDPVTGRIGGDFDRIAIYPRTHYVTPRQRLLEAMENIRKELDERLTELRAQDRLLEAQRLSQRTLFDLEMMGELGYCNGIENYSPSFGTQARRATADSHRLLSERLPDGHRRVPSDGTAGPRHVGRRSLAKRDAGRIWIPPSQRDRQPASLVRRVRRKAQSNHLRFSDARLVRARKNRRAVRRAGDPADRAARSDAHRPAGEGTSR
jgi:excinuclease ABC subunit B